MDYRNADGSIAEMCGNGVRVFAEYLFREGHLSLEQVQAGVPLATRGGVKRVIRRPDGWWSVAMGDWDVAGGAVAVEAATTPTFICTDWTLPTPLSASTWAIRTPWSC